MKNVFINNKKKKLFLLLLFFSMKSQLQPINLAFKFRRTEIVKIKFNKTDGYKTK